MVRVCNDIGTGDGYTGPIPSVMDALAAVLVVIVGSKRSADDSQEVAKKKARDT